jgi:hypothetical protein
MSATCRAMRQIPTWLHHGYDPTTASGSTFPLRVRGELEVSGSCGSSVFAMGADSPVPLKSRELHEHAAIFCIAAENPR